MFFIKNLSISFLVFAIIFGAIFLYFSGKTISNTSLSNGIKEREAMVSMVAYEVFSKTDGGLQEKQNLSNINNILKKYAHNNKSINFFRLVDVSTSRVLVSSVYGEAGSTYKQTLAVKKGETIVEKVLLRNTEKRRNKIDITHLGGANLALWLEVDPVYFSGLTTVLLIQQAIFLLAMFGVIGWFLFMLKRRFVVKPLQAIQKSLFEIDSKQGEKEIKIVPSNDIGVLLESFAGTARKLDATLHRDKLVSEMKSNFITTTAHQLRTPLSGISWALGALLADGDNFTGEQRLLVERSLNKSKELISIVGTLLDAASIEEGRFGYRFEELSVKKEIQEIINDRRAIIERDKVELLFESKEEEIPTIQGDRERIRWVLLNLIDNAIKYTNAGGRVSVSVEVDTDFLKILVKDNGIGIAKDAQDKIFSKFFRSKEAVEKRDDGSGLGLFIAKNIVLRHGGKMWFESELNKGSVFYFTLSRNL